MWRLLILCATLLCVPIGRAEALTTLGDFIGASESDSGTEWWPASSTLWSNAFTKPCRARTTGIAIAPPESSGGQSGMKWTSEEPITVASLEITCILTAASAKKNQTLGIQINAEERLDCPITFSAVNTPLTLTLSLPQLQMQQLILTNETYNSTALFTVQTVRYRSTPEPVNVTPSIPDIVFCRETLHCGLENISGGSDDYTSAIWTFNGEERILAADELLELVTFTAPSTDGNYPLTLMIEDAEHGCTFFNYSVEVRAYTAATNLTASDVTRDSLTLSWDLLAGGDPTHFRVQVAPHNAEDNFSLELSPTWTAVDGEKNMWQLDGILPIADWAKGRALSLAYLQVNGWKGKAEVLRDGTETWEEKIVASTLIFLPISGENLSLRVIAEEPPETLTAVCGFKTWIVDKEVPTGSGNRSTSIEGLSAGTTYDLFVNTTYTRDDGTTVTRGSAPLTLTTEAIPTFTAWSIGQALPSISLTWDEKVADLPAQISFWAEVDTEHTLPDGLYLSRILLAGKDDDLTLPTAKAIALSNTSRSPIPLNGQYSLRASRPRTQAEINAGKTDPVTTTWDFSVKVDGKTSYPHTIPPGGELLLFAQRYTHPEDAVTTTSAALAYLTPAYTLSLYHNDTPINTLTPKINAVTRLVDDALSATSTPIKDVTSLPTALTDPWCSPTTTRYCSGQVIQPNNGYAFFLYAPFMPPKETLHHFWATAHIFDNTGTSAPITLDLYTRPTPTTPGYLFRLR